MRRRCALGVLCVVLLAGVPVKAEQKEPAVAGLLGLVPGFGTGYFYAGHHGKGLTSAALDLVTTIGFVATADLEDESGPTVVDLVTGREIERPTAGLFFLVRIGSGIWQCIDGIATVNRDNRRGVHSAELGHTPRFGFQVGLTDFAGVPRRDFAAMSFAHRHEFGDLAFSHSRAVAAQPRVMLHVNAADLGAGLSFHQQF